MSFLLFKIAKFLITVHTFEFHWHMLSIVLPEVSTIIGKIWTSSDRTVNTFLLVGCDMGIQFCFSFVSLIAVFCEAGITWDR